MNKENLKLKGYRVQADLTQTDMANHLGMTRQNYALKENGVLKFNQNEINKIILLLKDKNVDVSYENIFMD